MVVSVMFNITHVIDLVSWLLELSTLHSTVNTILMMSIIKPYRKGILELVRRGNSISDGNILKLELSQVWTYRLQKVRQSISAIQGVLYR